MNMIKQVTQEDIMQAATIHSESWKESHKQICSPEFLANPYPRTAKKLSGSRNCKGAQLYMLIDQKPVGIVSVRGSLIENLYVLPDEQNKGYGTQLLLFAVEKCAESPSLWILSTNDGAKRLYERNGFEPTGNIIPHAGGVYELELCLRQV